MAEIENTITLSNVSRFMDIAKEAKHLAQLAADTRNELISKVSVDHDKIIEAASCVHKNSTVSVVFSVMGIEAFINELGIMQFSNKFFKNHLDNLKLISKLVLIPKLLNKHQIDTDGQLYEDLVWLINLRNYLVHFRKSERNLEDIDYSEPMSQNDFIMEQHSERAVNTMVALISYFNDDTDNTYRDRDAPHRAPLPHHAAYGSVLRDSADQAESDPGEHKSK